MSGNESGASTARWHIVNGEPRRCMAQPGHCPYGGIHYDDLRKAMKAAEQQNQRNHGRTNKISISRSTDAINKVNEDWILQSRVDRAERNEPRIPLPPRDEINDDWRAALDDYRRFVSHGASIRTAMTSSKMTVDHKSGGMTRADAIHVAARTVWLLREGRKINGIDGASKDCADDVDYRGVYRPAFGATFADPRMEVDSAWLDLQTRIIDETLSRGLGEMDGDRWTVDWRRGRSELDDLAKTVWPKLDDDARRRRLDETRDQVVSFLAVNHRTIGMMTRTVMEEPKSSGAALKRVYEATRSDIGQNGRRQDVEPLDDVILDSGRSLGDVLRVPALSYVDVRSTPHVDGDVDLPVTMMWRGDVRSTATEDP